MPPTHPAPTSSDATHQLSEASLRPAPRKAVIPAAGLGTRFLPFSKAVPKEMLPVVDKPVIQYIVEEAVAAGLDDILIVTSRHKKAVEDHFDRSPELEQALEANGKGEQANQLRQLAAMATIHFVRQGEAAGLGHAISLAQNHVGDQPFVVLLGDSIMKGGSATVAAMIDAYRHHGSSVVALMEVAEANISSYGCAAVTRFGPDPDLLRVNGLVEKPAPGHAPSNLAVAGRYLFTPQIFSAIDGLAPSVGGEIQITDALAALAATPSYGVLGYRGQRFDTGDKLDYLRAVVEHALHHRELGPDFRRLLVDALAADPVRPDKP